MKSRFSNKVFNGEMIVITSSVPLVFWYKGKDDKGNYYHLSEEDLVQLYRRISCYVTMTDKMITVYGEGVDEHGKPKGKGQLFKNELAKFKVEQTVKTDYNSMFGKICENGKLSEAVQLTMPIDDGKLPF